MIRGLLLDESAVKPDAYTFQLDAKRPYVEALRGTAFNVDHHLRSRGMRTTMAGVQDLPQTLQEAALDILISTHGRNKS